MAKDDDDSLPPLGENTEKFLEQAKKGQARNFLLVCKGTKVTYLAVRKKSIKKNELNEAKKAGYKGDGYFGVITGSGMELVFNLSIADGYESEPVKDKVLKDFLEEHANLKCKPSFAIVATSPEIPFDEEDLSHPLIARFLGLAQNITNVLDANPNGAGEVQQKSSDIRLLLQDGNFGEAEPRIDAFAIRLSQLLAGESAANDATVPTASQPGLPQSPAPAQTDDQTLKLKLQEALNKLVPQIKQAVATFPEKKVELLTPVAEIKKQLDTGDLQEAKKGIIAVGQLLKSVIAQSGSHEKTQPENDLRVEYERKLAGLQPSYAQALNRMLGDTSKFRTVMTYAMEQAGAGIYGNAIKAIDRLAIAIDQAIAVSGTEEKQGPGGDVETSGLSIAKLGKARIEWQSTRQNAIASMAKLKVAIQDAYAPEPAMAQEVNAAFQRLDSIFATLNETLYEQLDLVVNEASPQKRIELAKVAKATMNAFVAFVNSDTVMKELDGNEFAPDTQITGPIKSKLGEIAAALG